MRELIVNLGFDLDLRSRIVHPEPAHRKTRVQEGVYAWLIGPPPEDSLRLEGSPPEGFIETAVSLGLPVARVTLAPRVRVEAHPTPYGWDRPARQLVRAYARPPVPPPYATVRTVNGRAFADRVSRQRLDDDPGPGVAASVEEVERRLATDAEWQGGFVLKAEHGNAGLGNRRLPAPRLRAADRSWLEGVLAEHDVVVVERWRRRVSDLCLTFHVGSAGRAEGVSVHETVHTAAGAFVGALFDPAGPAPATWAARATATADTVASELATAGYFGPVCVDAFVWWDGRRARLRPLADLNARRHASWPGRQLWRRWAPDRVVYWRLFARRRLALPDDPRSVPHALGDDALDPSRREGVVVVSPTALGNGGRLRPVRRVAVAFVARDRRRVFGMEAAFRDRLER